MKKIVFILLSIFVFTLAFISLSAKASGTIYIKADGSIDPSSASISSVDNVTYTFSDNINDNIVVERSNIIIDGAGYTLQGSGSGDGFNLTNLTNVTIQNTNIKSFNRGLYLYQSTNNTISGNNITNNYDGVFADASSYITVSGNNVTNNSNVGVVIAYQSSNTTISANTIAGAR